MGMSTIQGDLFVNGSFTATAFNSPSNSVNNAAVQAAAKIDASKLQHQYQPRAVFGDHATVPAASRQALHKVNGATGQIISFGVDASVIAGAASSITVDLKKNGASILSATITLDNTTAANLLKTAAGFTSTALVAGDRLDAEITAVAGVNLPKGVACWLVVREDAQ